MKTTTIENRVKRTHSGYFQTGRFLSGHEFTRADAPKISSSFSPCRQCVALHDAALGHRRQARFAFQPRRDSVGRSLRAQIPSLKKFSKAFFFQPSFIFPRLSFLRRYIVRKPMRNLLRNSIVAASLLSALAFGQNVY